MNKDNIKKICSVLLYVTVFITFTGCEEFANEQSFQTVTVKQQQTAAHSKDRNSRS